MMVGSSPYLCTHTRTYTHTYTHTHVPTYAHTHIHTDTHTQGRSSCAAMTGFQIAVGTSELLHHAGMACLHKAFSSVEWGSAKALEACTHA